MPYTIIKNIKEELLNNNILGLPDYPTENELSRYRNIMLNYKVSLIAAFQSLFGDMLGNDDAVKFIDDEIDIDYPKLPILTRLE